MRVLVDSWASTIHFFLRQLGKWSATCDMKMKGEEHEKKKRKQNSNSNEMAAHGLRVHSTKTLMADRCVRGDEQRWRLTEAVRCHMGDTYRGRERSRFTYDASFPCWGRKASSSFSNVVGEICRLVIYDQPAEH